ncbi:MAG TPA: S26 family signal peptidase [Actinomycetota bacterium]
MPATYHRGRKRSQAGTALLVGVAVAYSFLRWKPFRVEISGGSMAPALRPGDWALAVAPGRVRRGDIVVAEHPERPGFEMVKRVAILPDELAPDGGILGLDEYWVEGDDPANSTDSRHFGPVRREQIKAKVRLIYWPPSRRRLL